MDGGAGRNADEHTIPLYTLFEYLTHHAYLPLHTFGTRRKQHTMTIIQTIL